jgi:Cysteine dioxygenase type I
MQSAAATPSPSSPHEDRELDLDLPGRILTRSGLSRLVAAVAARPALWQRHVIHDAGRRQFVQLYRDLHVDLWLLCWTNQQETGFHDHDRSSGAVVVVDGDLVEDRLELAAGGLVERSVPRPAGASFDFEASHVHRVRHPEGRPPAVSIHAYSPPLWRMGYYDTDASGVFRRTSVSYAEELSAEPAPVVELGMVREVRAESLDALGDLLRLLGYPHEWAVELERREFGRGRTWRTVRRAEGS